MRPVWGGMRRQQPGVECAVMHVQELRGPALSPGLPGKGEHSSRAVTACCGKHLCCMLGLSALVGLSACSGQQQNVIDHDFRKVPEPASCMDVRCCLSL